MAAGLSGITDILRDLYLGDGEAVLVFELKKKWTCPEHWHPHYDVWGYTCGEDECPHPEHYAVITPGCPLCKEAEYVFVEPLTLTARLTGGLKWQLEQEILLMRGMFRDDLSRDRYGD